RRPSTPTSRSSATGFWRARPRGGFSPHRWRKHWGGRCGSPTTPRNCDAVWWDCNHEGGKDPAASRKERPSATYHIATTDPRWLAHLAPGMEWDSMAFDLGYAHGETPVVDPSWRTRAVMGLAAAIDSNSPSTGFRSWRTRWRMPGARTRGFSPTVA